jgi:ribose transport system ATP-binding protein
LSARAVGKTFGANVALDRLDLDIAPGEIHALVGENGSGKSTFIKILAGYHLPDPGAQIEVGGAVVKAGSPDSSYERGCRFVHQDLGLIDDASVLDNLCYTGGFPTRHGTIGRKDARSLASAMLERVGLNLDPRTLVRELDAATKTAVAMARALRSDTRHAAHLLVLDEPTATMPDHEVENLIAVVRQVAASGVGVLYVSHRLAEIFRLCDWVTVLRDGREVASRTTGEFTHRTLVNALVGSEFEQIREVADELPVEGEARAGLEVRGLRAGSVKDFSLQVHAGTVTGIAGITGSGRESVLSAIFGAVQREAGDVVVAGTRLRKAQPASSIRNGLAYLPPDRKNLGGLMDQSGRENLALLDLKPYWRRWHLSRRAEVRDTREWFSLMAVRPADGYERTLATFSGGNQQKILFAKWLRIRPSVLLLDEPTQGVDVNAKAALHNQLLDVARDGGAVLVSSTDAEELAAICSRVLVIRDGRIAEELTGRAVTQDAITRACLGRDEEAEA